MTDSLLAVRDLRTWFEGEGDVARAVDGVSLDVSPGETLGLVGESGCGKSLTALSILGLLPTGHARIQEGSSIRFQGRELVGASSETLRSIRGNEIAMIFQDPMSSLNPVYRVGEQIAEAVRLHLGFSRRDARSEAVRLLREVRIPEPERLAEAYPHQLSGGMRQRVMIAMALSCSPSLLIADEPTTALDVTIQAQILELLMQLRAERDMAMLLITHDLGIVAQACDRVAVMYAGQIVETAEVRDLFERPAHPYTRGLLASLPTTGDRTERLRAIPGTVPSPSDWPSGCRFRTRCGLAEDECGSDQVARDLPGTGRSVRCWKASA
jgi:oligopeptide/dipeptide ABC transporter ATP-binding protein